MSQIKVIGPDATKIAQVKVAGRRDQNEPNWRVGGLCTGQPRQDPGRT